MYYANEESDDVIGGFIKAAQHSIENNSKNLSDGLQTWDQHCTSQKGT